MNAACDVTGCTHCLSVVFIAVGFILLVAAAWSNFIAVFALAMAPTENSFTDSSVGNESVMLSEYEGNNGK